MCLLFARPILHGDFLAATGSKAAVAVPWGGPRSLLNLHLDGRWPGLIGVESGWSWMCPSHPTRLRSCFAVSLALFMAAIVRGSKISPIERPTKSYDLMSRRCHRMIR
jgi:hypothetical protein